MVAEISDLGDGLARVSLTNWFVFHRFMDFEYSLDIVGLKALGPHGRRLHWLTNSLFYWFFCHIRSNLKAIQYSSENSFRQLSVMSWNVLAGHQSAKPQSETSLFRRLAGILASVDHVIGLVRSAALIDLGNESRFSTRCNMTTGEGLLAIIERKSHRNLSPDPKYSIFRLKSARLVDRSPKVGISDRVCSSFADNVIPSIRFYR